MTRDYLDFSVEHLSKWWRMGGDDDAPAIMAFAIGKLQGLVQKALQKPPSSLMNTTLAILPFHMDANRGGTEEKMEIIALAATMASLLQHGVGRILVVGYSQTDKKCAQIAFQQVLRYGRDEHNMTTTSSYDAPQSTLEQFDLPYSVNRGSTELVFVYATDMNSTEGGSNVPKGALKGLHTALLNGTNSTIWLGESPSKFKNIYFTEPDQILNARLTPHFIREIVQGKIMIPHRLQPIPHPLDLAGIVEEGSLLPENQFANVFQLDATTEQLLRYGKTSRDTS